MQDVSGEDMEWLVPVDAETAGGRLDAVLAKAVPAFSRNRIKDLILSGSVAINGRALLEPNYRLKAGDEILLVAPEPVDADPTPENIPLDILYEDAELIVINKPVGMVVHPAPGNLAGTLVNALLYHCGDSHMGFPAFVHTPLSKGNQRGTLDARCICVPTNWSSTNQWPWSWPVPSASA